MPSSFEHLPGLRQNRIAVVGRNPRLHRDVEAAAIPRLNCDMQIRAHILPRVPGLANPRRLFFHRTRHNQSDSCQS